LKEKKGDKHNEFARTGRISFVKGGGKTPDRLQGEGGKAGGSLFSRRKTVGTVYQEEKKKKALLTARQRNKGRHEFPCRKLKKNRPQVNQRKGKRELCPSGKEKKRDSVLQPGRGGGITRCSWRGKRLSSGGKKKKGTPGSSRVLDRNFPKRGDPREKKRGGRSLSLRRKKKKGQPGEKGKGGEKKKERGEKTDPLKNDACRFWREGEGVYGNLNCTEKGKKEEEYLELYPVVSVIYNRKIGKK